MWLRKIFPTMDLVLTKCTLHRNRIIIYTLNLSHRHQIINESSPFLVPFSFSLHLILCAMTIIGINSVMISLSPLAISGRRWPIVWLNDKISHFYAHSIQLIENRPNASTCKPESPIVNSPHGFPMRRVWVLQETLLRSMRPDCIVCIFVGTSATHADERDSYECRALFSYIERVSTVRNLPHEHSIQS